MDNFTIKDGNYYVLGSGMGNDANPGTIDAPRATLGDAISGKKCILRGTVEENVRLGQWNGISITGDTNAKIKGSISKEPNNGIAEVKLRNLTVDSITTDTLDIENIAATLTTIGENYTNTKCSNNILILYQCMWTGTETAIWRNLTIKGFRNGCAKTSIIYDSICYGFFDLYNFSSRWTFAPIFKYSIFLKNQTTFKWNGAVIPITWTEPGNEKQDVIDSLQTYADSISDTNQKNYLLNIAENMFGAGTIVYDDSPANIRIFNRYDADGNPSDLNLNMQNGNPALFSSSEGDYTGAKRPAFQIQWDWENRKSLDTNGDIINETPDLLQENNGIFVNIYSSQTRNQVKATQVLTFPAGDKLSKIAADFHSATDRGFYFGPWQNEITGIFPIDAFEADVYDTPENPSAYPHLLVPFNKELEIAYFKTGDKAGQPATFADLESLDIATNKNLTEVANWAVTNGAIEFYDITQLENIEIRKPKFKHIRLVLTVNNNN
jgi:hypothetical protein